MANDRTARSRAERKGWPHMSAAAFWAAALLTGPVAVWLRSPVNGMRHDSRRMSPPGKRNPAWLLCFVLVWAAWCPLSAAAAESKQKTVRVGYYVNECFQEGASDEDVKSGYGYEYLRKVACYTGWKYEYVYGKWIDLYEQFLAGDIDIMAGVSKLDEREDFLRI